MQLYAFDDEQKIVSAHKALKHKDYTCLECKGVVRRRGGIHRARHFFHLRPSSSCRQQAKSMAHIQTQCFIEALLPKDECRLEYPFAPIKRIADVAWLPRKIVFEIQCSSISSDEIQSRNADYASQGFQVVWILHDGRFNQWKLSAAEYYLQRSPHYFTNMDAEGLGKIYDQFQIIENGTRKKRLPALEVDLSLPISTWEQSKENFDSLPQAIQDRFRMWPVCFPGDLMHKSLEGPEEYLIEAAKLENEALRLKRQPKSSFLKKLIFNYIVRPYDLVFKMLLEKACK